jgi:hypothetical protein
MTNDDHEDRAKQEAAERARSGVTPSGVPSLPQVFAALDGAKLPEDFMSDTDRDRSIAQPRPALDQLFGNDGKDKN